MIKSIIKEIIIVLLLLLAIVLALGVLFYDYIPTNKLVPSIDTYATSESVKAELNEQVTNEETVLTTYEITESDLSTYAKTNQYKKGKANPFSTYEEPTPDENTVGGVNNTNSINANVNSNSTKGNNFYKNTGTK